MDKCIISVSFKYLQIKILGVQLKAFSRSKLEGFYKATKMHIFWECIEVGSKCVTMWSKLKDKYEIEKKKTQTTGAFPSNWPWFEIFD